VLVGAGAGEVRKAVVGTEPAALNRKANIVTQVDGLTAFVEQL